MTKQRQVLLEELKKLHSHPTAIELYEIVRKRLPHISLGTVYRNLEFLADIGLINKLEIAGVQKRFDGKTENHYHIRCIRCNRVEDVPLEPIPEVERAVTGVSDYEVLTHRLEFVGLCPACRREAHTKEAPEV
jgi:Fur family ferric uptake transcriptional regulator